MDEQPSQPLHPRVVALPLPYSLSSSSGDDEDGSDYYPPLLLVEVPADGLVEGDYAPPSFAKEFQVPMKTVSPPLLPQPRSLQQGQQQPGEHPPPRRRYVPYVELEKDVKMGDVDSLLEENKRDAPDEITMSSTASLIQRNTVRPPYDHATLTILNEPPPLNIPSSSVAQPFVRRHSSSTKRVSFLTPLEETLILYKHHTTRARQHVNPSAVAPSPASREPVHRSAKPLSPQKDAPLLGDNGDGTFHLKVGLATPDATRLMAHRDSGRPLFPLWMKWGKKEGGTTDNNLDAPTAVSSSPLSKATIVQLMFPKKLTLNEEVTLRMGPQTLSSTVQSKELILLFVTNPLALHNVPPLEIPYPEST